MEQPPSFEIETRMRVALNKTTNYGRRCECNYSNAYTNVRELKRLLTNDLARHPTKETIALSTAGERNAETPFIWIAETDNFQVHWLCISFLLIESVIAHASERFLNRME
jgi:hypothetical protein